MAFELTRELIEAYQVALAEETADDWFVASEVHERHPVELATILRNLEEEEQRKLWTLMPTKKASQVVAETEPGEREDLLSTLPPRQIAGYVDLMDSDDAADVLGELTIRLREEVIARLESGQKAGYLRELLRYEEGTAGALMAKELVKARAEWTVGHCIEEIRRLSKTVEKVLTVYVVDGQNKLVGRLPLKRLLLSDPQTLVADLQVPQTQTVEVFTPDEEVADMMRRYDLEALPVVDVKGHLIGRITIDDIVDVLTEQAERERNLMTGVTEDVEADDSVWTLARSRLPWLVIGMAGGLIGAQFMGLFEEDLRVLPAMAFFVPLITATGGNVGIQSASLVVQSLANRDALRKGVWSQVVKALIVGLLNGVVLAGGVFLFASLFLHELYIAVAVSIALFSVVVLASLNGTVTPLILDRVKINPALASGPFITTINDLLGLTVYFLVAHLLLIAH